MRAGKVVRLLDVDSVPIGYFLCVRPVEFVRVVACGSRRARAHPFRQSNCKVFRDVVVNL